MAGSRFSNNIVAAFFLYLTIFGFNSSLLGQTAGGSLDSKCTVAVKEKALALLQFAHKISLKNESASKDLQQFKLSDKCDDGNTSRKTTSQLWENTFCILRETNYKNRSEELFSISSELNQRSAELVAELLKICQI